MKKEKKKFLTPEAGIVFFEKNDIIATSAMTEGTDSTYGEWDDQDGDNWWEV